MPEALRYLDRLIDVNGGCLPPPNNYHKQHRYKNGRDGRVHSIRNVITVIASALALIIKQIESSKCTHIKCCGMDCDRNVPPAKEEEDMETPRLATPEPSP